MPPLHHSATHSFGASALLTFIIVFLALVYIRGWRQLHQISADVIAPWQASSFFLGLFLIGVAVASPIAALDHELLTAHMVQHLLLMTLAPPLIWLGAPLKPLLHGLPRQFARGIVVPMFRRPLLKQLGRALAQPKFCWLAAAAVLVGWHIPALFALGMQSEVWHAIEQASFLAAGLLFWWPVVQPWPSVSMPDWSIIVYLFLATLPCDILSGFLVFCDRVVYSAYSSSPQPFGFSALGDQECAGALMWTCVTIVYLVAGSIISTQLLSPQHFRKDKELTVAQRVLQNMEAL
jgi:putative membrane protein